MSFIYVSERERWRTVMLLLWKRGPLDRDIASLGAVGGGGAGNASSQTRRGPGGGLAVSGTNGPAAGPADPPRRKEPVVKLICEFAAPPWPDQPVRKLTVNLINTYTNINTSYYASKSKWQASLNPVAATGNFMWAEGKELTLNNRYQCKQQIGHGAFGVVIRAVDLQTGENVAIKIIKAKRAYSQQARREIRLLQELRAKDGDGSSHVVELRGHFVYQNPGVGNHECLVFEMLSSNLYTLLEQVQFHGFSLPLVRKFAESLLHSLAFLARPDVMVIHTDIKPENICIRNPRRSAIKLIDFGSSCKEGHQLFSYIQSRYYRSPEVLLGCGYSVSIDVWSLACVLVEMHVGSPLFSGDNAVDQLRKIMLLCGAPPDEMVESLAEEKRSQLFTQNPRADLTPKWIPKDSGIGTKSLDSVFGCVSGGGGEDGQGGGGKVPPSKWEADSGHSPCDYEAFGDMIMKMLAVVPSQRLTPSDGLLHPFITQDYPGSVRRQEQSARDATAAAAAAGAAVSVSVPAGASSVATSSGQQQQQQQQQGVGSVQRGIEDRGHLDGHSSGSGNTRRSTHKAVGGLGTTSSGGGGGGGGGDGDGFSASGSGGSAGGGGATVLRSGKRFGNPIDGSSAQGGPKQQASSSSSLLSMGGGGGGGAGGLVGNSASAAAAAIAHANAAGCSSGGGGGGAHISGKAYEKLSAALLSLGCPLTSAESLSRWSEVESMLLCFTAVDGAAVAEAQTRFHDFINQPLRHRQEQKLDLLVAHLLASTASSATSQQSPREAAHHNTALSSSSSSSAFQEGLEAMVPADSTIVSDTMELDVLGGGGAAGCVGGVAAAEGGRRADDQGGSESSTPIP